MPHGAGRGRRGRVRCRGRRKRPSSSQGGGADIQLSWPVSDGRHRWRANASSALAGVQHSSGPSVRPILLVIVIIFILVALCRDDGAESDAETLDSAAAREEVDRLYAELTEKEEELRLVRAPFHEVDGNVLTRDGARRLPR